MLRRRNLVRRSTGSAAGHGATSSVSAGGKRDSALFTIIHVARVVFCIRGCCSVCILLTHMCVSVCVYAAWSEFHRPNPACQPDTGPPDCAADRLVPHGAGCLPICGTRDRSLGRLKQYASCCLCLSVCLCIGQDVKVSHCFCFDYVMYRSYISRLSPISWLWFWLPRCWLYFHVRVFYVVSAFIIFSSACCCMSVCLFVRIYERLRACRFNCSIKDAC